MIFSRNNDDALKVICNNRKWQLLTFNENLERSGTVFCIYCQKSFMFNLKLSSIKTFNQIFQIEISQFTDASLKSVICVLTIERKLNMGIYFVQMQ